MQTVPEPKALFCRVRISINMLFAGLFSVLLMILSFQSVSGQNSKKPVTSDHATHYDTATFANGCFWCTEAVFQELKGVISVTSGYSGGTTKNPTYRQVCTGTTGHAEACQIVYNPGEITFAELLEVFWKTHDPTTLNRQGNDEGTQYRSAIFYQHEAQRLTAEKYKLELNKSMVFPDPIVTEITPYKNFYKAENYHQDYFNLHGEEPYCRLIIQPKLDKFKRVFRDKLRK